MLVYRIQPQGADLHGIETETSNGESAGGVHVFTSIPEIIACDGWMLERSVELVTVDCEPRDIRSNDDYEGDLLIAGRGTIISRKKFRDTMAVSKWAAKARK